MNNHVKEFEKLLLALNGDNLVLAGSIALIEHGLIMSRLPLDLDVVIYQPNDKQKELLKAIYLVALDNKVSEYPFETTKQFKFLKNGFHCNILIEDKFVPVDLLYYQNNGVFYKIQNIKINMQAKMSFKTKDGKYREKDLLDCIDLKNSNFNIN